VIPLKDDNPTRGPAVVTLVLIGLCIAVYFFVQPAGQGSVANSNPQDKQVQDLRFTLSHAAVPYELTHGRPLTGAEVDAAFPARGGGSSSILCEASGTGTCYPHKNVWLAVLYSMFLHGSLLHLAGNMLFLWIFGNNIEDRLGRAGYVAFYLAAGLVATVAQVAFSPSSAIPMIGASGAIAGVMGAYLVLYPNVRIRSLIFVGFFVLFRDVQAKWLLGIWFVLQFFTSANSGVAWMAHVGGFVFGALAGLAMRARPQPAVL
jgi:membrane associated rhomboid family serine protease